MPRGRGATARRRGASAVAAVLGSVLLAGTVLSAGERTATGPEQTLATAASAGRTASAAHAAPGSDVGRRAPGTSAPSSGAGRVASAALPVTFEANRGQADPAFTFLARGHGYSLALGAGGAVFTVGGTREGTAAGVQPPDGAQPAAALRPPDGAQPAAALRPPDGAQPAAAVRMWVAGADPGLWPVAGPPRAGVANYVIGSDPGRWQLGVPTYASVAYPDLVPGVDLVFHGERGRPEYDLRVLPGASPGSLVLAFAGQQALSLDAGGDLVVHTAAGDLVQAAPAAYQEVQGARRAVVASYVLTGPDRVGFRLGAYDGTRPLVVDPVIAYSTYLGGGGDIGRGIAVDRSGSVFVAGETTSSAFPGTGGGYAGNGDAFVAKLTPDGSGLVYATYLGGSGQDAARGIAIDAGGDAFVAGETESRNFPVLHAYQAGNAGAGNAFVAKLDRSGALVYSTYLGGGRGDFANGVAVDPAGRASVVGVTQSPNFPTTNGSSLRGTSDAFVTKLSTSGSELVFSTYLGGSQSESASGVAADAAGNTYVTGRTDSDGMQHPGDPSPVPFPTTANAYQRTRVGGQEMAFASKLGPDGALLYSTLLGTDGQDSGRGIAADGGENAYATYEGGTYPEPAVMDHVIKLDTRGGGAVYVATLAVPDEITDEGPEGIAVDRAGDAYVTGTTGSSAFPVKGNPCFPQAAMVGNTNAFVLELSGNGATAWATYLGGSGEDGGHAIAVDAAGSAAYVTGDASSVDFPVTAGALQPRKAGGTDAFVTKLGSGCPSPSLPPGPNLPPAVTGLTPASGPVTGMTSVAVSGIGFQGATAVHFDTATLPACPPGPPASPCFTPQSGTALTAYSPPHAAGPVDVTVDARGLTSARTPLDVFTYLPRGAASAPVVTGVAPSCGPSGGGTGVTITGAGFTGARSLHFGAVAAPTFAVVSDGTITASTPARAQDSPATVDVTVTTALGTSAAAPADRFTFDETCGVLARGPDPGPQPGVGVPGGPPANPLQAAPPGGVSAPGAGVGHALAPAGSSAPGQSAVSNAAPGHSAALGQSAASGPVSGQAAAPAQLPLPGDEGLANLGIAGWPEQAPEAVPETRHSMLAVSPALLGSGAGLLAVFCCAMVGWRRPEPLAGEATATGGGDA